MVFFVSVFAWWILSKRLATFLKSFAILGVFKRLLVTLGLHELCVKSGQNPVEMTLQYK